MVSLIGALPYNKASVTAQRFCNLLSMSSMLSSLLQAVKTKRLQGGQKIVL